MNLIPNGSVNEEAMPPFAEADSWVQTLVAFIVGGGLIGGVIKLLDWLKTNRESREKTDQAAKEKDRKDRIEDEQRDQERTDRYIARVEAELKESRQEVHDLRDQLVTERVRAERRAVWIKGMQAFIKGNGLEFPEWSNGPSEVELHGPDGGQQ